MLQKALEATSSLFAEIERMYSWVGMARSILNNAQNKNVLEIRRAYRHLLSEMLKASRDASRFIQNAIFNFTKISRSYWLGIFGCYSIPELPRTNNVSEQGFGSFRYHERRCSGAKVISGTSVARGPVRIISATLQPKQPFSGEDLRLRDIGSWRQLRTELNEKQELRRQQRRFRQNPENYLAKIEEEILKTILPT